MAIVEDFFASLHDNGKSGLLNLGNTCYINASIQCLFHSPSLLYHFLHQQSNSALMRELQVVLSSLWKESKQYSPVCLVNNLKQCMSKRIDIAEQNDMSEFILALIETLCSELGKPIDSNRISDLEKSLIKLRGHKMKHFITSMELAWLKSINNDACFLTSLVFGQIISQTRCVNCKHITHANELFNSISLSITSCSLETMLATHFENELLTDWKCEQCKSTGGQKTIKIWRLPQILIIVLKRFNVSGRKIQDYVSFPSRLSLNNHSIYDTNCEFKLFSVGCHVGNHNSGHYFGYCKHPNTKWYCYDDDLVNETAEDVVMSTSNAYVLMFERQRFNRA